MALHLAKSGHWSVDDESGETLGAEVRVRPYTVLVVGIRKEAVVMFGSLFSKSARIAIQTVFAITVLLPAQAQAQSIVGTWTRPGLTVIFQADGRWTRYADDAARLAHCGGPETGGGTYTASAGSVSLADEGGWCGSSYVFAPPQVQTGSYSIAGNTLVMHLQGSPDGPMDLTLSAQGQAQSIVGTWTTQGRDWVWFFLANGRTVLVGTGVDPACSGVSSKSGTYTASATSLILSGDPYYQCNNNYFPQMPGTITANYLFSGNTLTLNNISSNDMGISTLALTLLPTQTAGIVGIWNAQGTDRVFDIRANGQYVLTGTGVGPNCTSAGSEQGTYSASAGVLIYSAESWTCGGTGGSGVRPAGQGGYAFTGNTLTVFVMQTSGQNVGAINGFILGPQDGTSTTVAPSTPLPPPPTVQTVYTAPSGQMPATAVAVSATGTFGSASLSVTLDIVQALQTTPATGFAASTYNVYVIALVPGAVVGSSSPVIAIKSGAGWSALQFPIAPYLENVAQGAANNRVLIEILSNNDITWLVGTEFYIGYGESDQEMLARGRYRGIYKVQ